MSTVVLSYWSMGMVWFNVPLDIILDHFRDDGVTAASARIVAAVRAEASATPQCVQF